MSLESAGRGNSSSKAIDIADLADKTPGQFDRVVFQSPNP
jgi:hypothetical protein